MSVSCATVMLGGKVRVVRIQTNEEQVAPMDIDIVNKWEQKGKKGQKGVSSN